MTHRHYEVGQIVFAEGEECDFVGRILDGEAEVSRRHGDEVVVIGYLRAGDHVGEMAAIEGSAHTATVRATGALTIDRIATPEFLRHASRDSELAFRLLERLSQRLHRMDDAYAAAVSANRTIAARLNGKSPEAPSRVAGRVPMVRLEAGSERVAAFLPPEGLTLDRLPFVVGRSPSFRERPPKQPADLPIDDTVPYRLSRLHFEVARRGGRVEVRDLNSHLGTAVNGSCIGRFFPRDAVELNAGENEIVAGGERSPYVFRAVVEG